MKGVTGFVKDEVEFELGYEWYESCMWEKNRNLKE